MFIVLLRLSGNRSAAGEFMDAHNAWLKRGFDDEAFLLAGSMKPGPGGAILAPGDSREAIEARVAADPFVANDVAIAEIVEIEPVMTDPRLQFLAG
jgi:uncharacterized protein YciI